MPPPQNQKNIQLIELLTGEENANLKSEKDQHNLLSLYDNTNISPAKVTGQPSLLESSNLLFEEEDKKSQDIKNSSDLFKEMKVKEKKENKTSDSNILGDPNLKNQSQINKLQSSLKDFYSMTEENDLFNNISPIKLNTNNKVELGNKKKYGYNDEKIAVAPQKSQFDFVNEL